MIEGKSILIGYGYCADEHSHLLEAEVAEGAGRVIPLSLFSTTYLLVIIA